MQHKSSVLAATVISAMIATVLYSFRHEHSTWDCWPWNFGCFMAVILGMDWHNGKTITWR